MMRCVYVHKNDIREWQLKTLAVQQELQGLFDQCKFANWVAGGTLIGAIRDKRFLYWDNDLDMFFMYEDYKKILFAFWENRLAEKYDIYFYRNGFWQKHFILMKLLSADKFDEQAIDFELKDFSENMFKVFARDGVVINMYKNEPEQSEDYVRVRHYSRHHMTRYRMIRRNDGIDGRNQFIVLPNVCMLPMVKITFFSYVTSGIVFLLLRLLSYMTGYLKGLERKLNDLNGYEGKGASGTQHKEIAEFDPTHLDSVKQKMITVFRNLPKAFFQYARNLLNRENGKLHIAYKPLLFRFIVLPFKVNDILPVKQIEFEGCIINIPGNFDKMLRIQFGNYMVPPHRSHRLALPFFIIDRMDVFH